MFIQNELERLEAAMYRGHALELDTARRRREYMERMVSFIDPLFDELKETFGEEIDLRLNDIDTDVRFTGDKKKLISVLRIVRKYGFEINGERTQEGNPEWYSYVRHPDCQAPVWIAFTSSVCRRVKVGTKMIEQDVYEVRCEDEAAQE